MRLEPSLLGGVNSGPASAPASLDPLSDLDLDEVTGEGERPLAFVEPYAEVRDVQFGPLSTA